MEGEEEVHVTDERERKGGREIWQDLCEMRLIKSCRWRGAEWRVDDLVRVLHKDQA